MKVDKSKWQEKRIEDFFNLQMGKTPSRKDLSLWDDGEIPWVSISDMKDNRYISNTKEYLSERTISECRIPIVPARTVIMSFKLTIGKTCITTKPLVTNEAIMAFYPKEGVEIDSSFLAYALSALKWKGNRAVKGVTVNKKIISQKMLCLPPIKEQEKIASELDAIQKMIDGYREQIADLDALAQSIFHETFGDISENPMGWEVQSLGNLCNVTSSKRIYQSELTKIGIPFLRISDFPEFIKTGKSTIDVFISRERYESLWDNGLTPKKDDLLITSRGTIGLCYTVKEDDCFYFQDGMITWLRDLDHSVKSSFLAFIFNGSLLKKQIDKEKNGSTVSYLSISMFKRLKIIVPPVFLQQKFIAQLSLIERQKELLRQQLADAEMLMAERMQYYFS